jgi:hypothetical protein
VKAEIAVGIDLDRNTLLAVLHFPSSSLRTSEARENHRGTTQALTFSISAHLRQYFGLTLSRLNIGSRLSFFTVWMLFDHGLVLPPRL